MFLWVSQFTRFCHGSSRFLFERDSNIAYSERGRKNVSLWVFFACLGWLIETAVILKGIEMFKELSRFLHYIHFRVQSIDAWCMYCRPSFNQTEQIHLKRRMMTVNASASNKQWTEWWLLFPTNDDQRRKVEGREGGGCIYGIKGKNQEISKISKGIVNFHEFGGEWVSEWRCDWKKEKSLFGGWEKERERNSNISKKASVYKRMNKSSKRESFPNIHDYWLCTSATNYSLIFIDIHWEKRRNFTDSRRLEECSFV